MAISQGVFAAVTITPATGGSAISADTAGGAYTLLTGPVISEGATAEIGTGTIILNVPTGFVFDTGGIAPTILITWIGGGSGAGGNNINNKSDGTVVAVGSVTTTQITYNITAPTENSALNSLTWQNIRVRPTAETPLASGNITKTGTSSIAGVTNGVTNLGTLTEVATSTPGSGRPRQGSITVTKKVINDDGGTKTVSDFPLFVNGESVTSGETNNFPAPGPVFTVTETGNSGYTTTFSGDCDANGQLNLNGGDNKFCIITNDDKPVSFPETGSALDFSNIDYNQDKKIDISDWSIFLSNWSSPDQALRNRDDLNGDGKLDVSDFSIFLVSFQLGSKL